MNLEASSARGQRETLNCHTCKDKLYTSVPEPASMFEANAKLLKTMGLVSTLLYCPRTNFILLHSSYQKRKATACCCLQCQI